MSCIKNTEYDGEIVSSRIFEKMRPTESFSNVIDVVISFSHFHYMDGFHDLLINQNYGIKVHIYFPPIMIEIILKELRVKIYLLLVIKSCFISTNFSFINSMSLTCT